MDYDYDGLPQVCSNIRFDIHPHEGIVFHVDTHEGNSYCFVRPLQRWRWRSGPFVSRHRIASLIFRYRQFPTTDEQNFMGDFVETIGDLMDFARETIKENKKQAEARVSRAWQEMRTRHSRRSTPPAKLYLMRHVNGLTKIGRSVRPKARERTLQAEDPRLRIIFSAKAGNNVEARLHKIFDRVRVRGEWFKLESHHVDWIASIFSHGEKHGQVEFAGTDRTAKARGDD